MSTGLLILCSPLSQLLARLGSLAKVVTQNVAKTLYVQLEFNENSSLSSPGLDKPSPETLNNCKQLISRFYLKCFDYSQTLDVRFILGAIKNPSLGNVKLGSAVDVILTDYAHTTNNLKDYLEWRYQDQYYSNLPVINIRVDENINSPRFGTNTKIVSSIWKFYDNTVLGGTFDRLHNGHKLLLTEAILRSGKCLTIGVTDGPMIQGKLLWELIEPVDVRIEKLKQFLIDSDASLNYRLEPIEDPYGPSIVDPELQCIVVSKETYKGGVKVNEQRLKKGMKTLDIQVIELLNDAGHAAEEEEKISSSSLRMRLLGQRRKNSYQNPKLPKSPYVIGLTGGIASGKSSICNRLKNLGAATINCDLLGHESYAVGTISYKQIVENFGREIINEDGNINRKALGQIVFSDPRKMDLLNSIVWPEIRRLVKKRIEELRKIGSEIVIVEAAVLLEAGWEDVVHEIWVSIITEKEAIKRLKSRNNLDEDQAKLRLESQISNSERIMKATVVFSTLWEPEYTQKQVETAWNELNYFLDKEKSVANKL